MSLPSASSIQPEASSQLNSSLEATPTTTTTGVNHCSLDHQWLYYFLPGFVLFIVGLISLLLWEKQNWIGEKLSSICKKKPSKGSVIEMRSFPYNGQSAEYGYDNRKENLPLVNSVENVIRAKKKEKKNRKDENKLTKYLIKIQELVSGKTLFGNFLEFGYFVFSLLALVLYFVEVTRKFRSISCYERVLRRYWYIQISFNSYFIIHFVIKLLTVNDRLKFWIDINSVADIFLIPAFIAESIADVNWLGLRFLRVFRLFAFSETLEYFRILKDSTSIKLAQLITLFTSVWLAASGVVHFLEMSEENPTFFPSFFDSFYFILITMSTVGYGDLYCKTLLGRIFIVFFIFIAVAIFATHVPLIIEIIEARSNKYNKKYKSKEGYRHVIIGGFLSYNNVSRYLSNVCSNDLDLGSLKSVFMDNKNPDLATEGLLKRYHTEVLYVKGNILSTEDLRNVDVSNASAVILLTNQKSSDPDEDDMKNIMKVISIKNCCPDVKVIVQLIQAHNKALCCNLPSWSNKDSVICYNEYKLGLISSNCIAPGFSTLLSNLIFVISYTDRSALSGWEKDYINGAGMEIYKEKFSFFFLGKPLPYVTEFCYNKLNLLLLGVTGSTQASSGLKIKQLILNPSEDYIVSTITKGYLIAQTKIEANVISNYCSVCHANVEPSQISACSCFSTELMSNYWNISRNPIKRVSNETLPVVKDFQSILDSEQSKLIDKIFFKKSKDSDYEPVVQRSDARPLRKTFEECIIDIGLNEDIIQYLDDHIVLICTNTEIGSLNGLKSFIIPLRESDLKDKKSRPIVIVGEDSNNLRKEWSKIKHFSDIYFFLENPMKPFDVSLINLISCHMCVIISARRTIEEKDCSIYDDWAALISTLNVRNITSKYIAVTGATKGDKPNQIKYNVIPIITEITNCSNAEYIDQDDIDMPDTPYFLSQPYACGRVFLSEIVHSISTSLAYTMPKINTILKSLIPREKETSVNFINEEMDELNNVAVKLVPVIQEIFQPYSKATFGILFNGCLKKERVLCLGLYRCMNIYDNDIRKNNYRIVITNPPMDFELFPTDMVYQIHSTS